HFADTGVLNDLTRSSAGASIRKVPAGTNSRRFASRFMNNPG
ncbi:MAG: hypothetical protein ACI8TQ_002664, partial [Planctomycetota bacterium]